jgi:hypothetical protein
MNFKVLLVSLATLCLLALLSHTATAQSLSLRLDAGAVTLHATNVTVDEILARWAKTTGLTVVSQNGHGSDIPITLDLLGVPERDALRLILRDLSGYIMGEKVDPLTGAVRIDRLVILPDSAARAPEQTPVRRRAAVTPVPVDPSNDVPRELAPSSDVQIETNAP